MMMNNRNKKRITMDARQENLPLDSPIGSTTGYRHELRFKGV
jgi:hypothetical protein